MNTLFRAGALVVVALLAFPVSSAGSTKPAVRENSDLLVLKPGRVAFLGTDGGNATYATVCRTMRGLQQLLDEPSPDAPTGCTRQPMGQRVVIIKTAGRISMRGADHVTFAIAQIQEANGKWTALASADATALVPILPSGTIVSVDGDTMIWRHQHDEFANHFTVAPGHARVLATTNDVQNANVKIQVIDGGDAGKAGWTLPSDLKINGASVEFKGGLAAP